MAKCYEDRELLAEYLKTQQVSIPDLWPIFKGWPGAHPEDKCPPEQVQQLRKDVDARLQSLYSSGAAKTLAALVAADFASFTALWWPDAALEEQRILAYFVIWLFTWDDEIDEPAGSVADDFAAAERYRAETQRFVACCLGLDDDSDSSDSGYDSDRGQLTQPTPIVQSFEEIGAALCAAYDVPQRQRFLAEMSRFMCMSAREQEIRLRGQLPTLAEYWVFRMGTSAVYLGVAVGEYANHTAAPLPASHMDGKTMRGIWDETNVIISITNDLLSLKKEIRKGCVDSVVPLTCAALGTTADDAIAAAVHQLAESRARFDAAAVALEAECAGEAPELREEARRFVRVCRTNCTGNLAWSLKTARYGMAEAEVRVDDGGACSFPLGSAGSR